MSNRPITEDDLHAYVDGVLEPEREAEVAIYLEGHPDMARRVAAFSDQRDLLRKALAPIADEPVPSQLNLSRMTPTEIDPQPSRSPQTQASHAEVQVEDPGEATANRANLSTLRISKPASPPPQLPRTYARRRSCKTALPRKPPGRCER